jgi:hypothetical protein
MKATRNSAPLVSVLFGAVSSVMVGAAVVVLATVVLVGQAPGPSSAPAPVASSASTTTSSYRVPRTPWGDPDLQGIWPSTNMVGVPTQRPVELGTRAVLTDEEFKAREAQNARQANADEEEFVAAAPAGRGGGDGTGPPSHWGERGTPQRQASLIVDPPNGRTPPMTPYGEQRMAMRARQSSTGQGPFNSAADLDYYDRCVSRGVLGSMLPVVYNNGTEIVQAPGYVAIRYEMIHDARIIPLDGRPGLPSAHRHYTGEARGHWEGDVLVVETTNFNGTIGVTGNGRLQPASDELRMVERFTRTGLDTMQYEATMRDLKTWTGPWKVSFPLTRDDDYGFYEYACHEGNNAMRNILSGARADERAAAGQGARP